MIDYASGFVVGAVLLLLLVMFGALVGDLVGLWHLVDLHRQALTCRLVDPRTVVC